MKGLAQVNTELKMKGMITRKCGSFNVDDKDQ